MNNASLENATAASSPQEGGNSSRGDTGVLNGDHSTQETARLQAECERLTTLVRKLEEDRDAYQKALNYFLAQEIKREDVELTATFEEGVPFEVILQDMEQILFDQEAAHKS